MDTSRSNLKAYRCFGGFMLFTGIFSNIMTMVSTPATLLFSNIFSSSFIGEETYMLMSAAVIIYTYYVGYRIFVKMHRIELLPFRPVRKGKLLPCIITCVLALASIRLIWYGYAALLNDLPIKIETSDASQMGIITVIYGCILAPIAEEIVFRGWLLKLLRKYGAVAAIFFTAVGFGLMHGNLFQAIPATAIGVIFAYMAIKYDSIIPTVILHIATNTISFIDTAGAETQYMKIFGWMMLAGLILFFWVNRHQWAKPMEDSPIVATLLIKSLSFIVFVLFSLLLIRLSYQPLACIRHLCYTVLW